MSDDINRLYEVANDREATMLDSLRERAGLVWTHRADDHTWTNPAGAPCERCDMTEETAVARGEADR